MKRSLSSLQTFLMKFVLPFVWITLFGVGAFSSFFVNDTRGDEPPKFLFVVVWIVGIAFLYWTCIRLKAVSVDNNFLFVSNYIKEIFIPLSDIYDVTENRWLNIHPITIHLRKPSEFGDKIIFMPTTKFFVFFTGHPVVNELKELAKQSSFIK